MFVKGKIEFLFSCKDRVREMELGNVAFELLIVVFVRVSNGQHKALKICDIAL